MYETHENTQLSHPDGFRLKSGTSMPLGTVPNTLLLSQRERALRIRKLPLLQIPARSISPSAIASAPLPSQSNRSPSNISGFKKSPTLSATAFPSSHSPNENFRVVGRHETIEWTFEKALAKREST